VSQARLAKLDFSRLFEHGRALSQFLRKSLTVINFSNPPLFHPATLSSYFRPWHFP